MIVRPKPRLTQLFFIMHGSIVPRIAPQILAIAALSLCVFSLSWWRPAAFAQFTVPPFTVLGLAISIFLGFRNNACYDRWWEARRQWSQLAADLGSLSREVMALLPGEERAEARQRIVRRGIGFAHALAGKLRHDSNVEATRAWLPQDEAAALQRRNVPSAVLGAIAADLAAFRGPGGISDVLYVMFETRLAGLASAEAACERLQSTPLPFTYTLLIHRAAYLFCFLLPFGLVGSLGITTPIATALVAYTFFGLDALGDELEEPFGRAQNSLPLDALVRLIEIDLLETLGERAPPKPLEPVRFLLR